MIAALLLRKLVEKIALYDDPIAYKEIFVLYYSRLVSFSKTITHSNESAEEVVCDVFLKIWMHRNKLLTVENFHLYIYVITKNLSINRRLKDRNKNTFSLDEIVVDITSLHPDPEQLTITSEMSKRIQQAIRNLPPKCQLIFKLVKEDGLKYKEVAELLSLSPKTVDNQMTIALKKLSESIRFNLAQASCN